MNNSVYEQIFRTQSVSDDVLCLELTNTQAVNRDRRKKKNPLPNNNISLPHHLPLTPSTLLLTTFHLSRQLSSSPPSTYAVNSPPHHLPLTPSTLLLTAFHLRRQLSSTPPSTYAVNSPPHHLPLTPPTLLLTIFHLRRQLSSSPPSTYAVNSSPRYLPLTPSTLLHTGTVKLN